MGEIVKKVLFVNSEIFPYLPETNLSRIGRQLPQGILERRMDIRSFMPRYGCINERKNQLHEVIRLSGMNIVISEVDHPLVIKVASIPSVRIQIYFIDNDDYFRRKGISSGDDSKFYADNDERAIFFARGVLETVKKLRWQPDVIHCQGWITHLVPAYLKMAYKDDPIFASSKVAVSLYDEKLGAFSPDFKRKAVFGGADEQSLSLLDGKDGLAKLAIRYSDGVILSSGGIDGNLVSFAKADGRPVLDYNEASYSDLSYIPEYEAFYEKI